MEPRSAVATREFAPRTDTLLEELRADIRFDAVRMAAQLDQLERDHDRRHDRERQRGHQHGADPDAAAVEYLTTELERAAEGELLWRSRLLRAEMIGRRDPVTAARFVTEVLGWGVANDCRRVVSRSHRVLARLSPARDAALDHMIRCVDALDGSTPLPDHIACLVGLAAAYGEAGSLTLAREHFEQAVRAAVEHGEVRGQMVALGTYAHAEYLRGEPVLARKILWQLQVACEEHARPMDFTALDTTARVEALLGDVAAAERAARAALRTFYRDGAAREDRAAEAGLLITVAHVQHLSGDAAGAQTGFDAARDLCELSPPRSPR
jgi:hypothetical protein